MTLGRRTTPVLTDLAILAAVGVFLYPVIAVILASIRPDRQLLTGGFDLQSMTLSHYAAMLGRPGFRRAALNSMIVATGSALLSTAIAMPAAYSLARFRYRGRDGAALLILVMKMVPEVVLLVPIVVLMRSVSLTNTLLGLTLMHLTLGLPVAVWMLRGYIADIPISMEEAARIDGCSRWQSLRYVVLPLLRPALVVICTFAFILSWGEYLYALSIISRAELQTLPLALQALFDPYSFSWGEIMAGGVLIALPVSAIFLFFRRHIVAGILSGGIKG